MYARFAIMAFGEEEFRYWQAHHCLLSLLAHAPGPGELVVATDHPERFRWFEGRVRIHALSPADLGQWMGPQRYFLRALIQTLRLAAALQPAADVAVYLDADTQALAPLAPLLEAARGGRMAMDRREYQLAVDRRRGSRRLWRQVGGRNWAGVAVDERTEMWNTGITAVGAADYPLVDRALAVCDAMLAAGVDHYLTEQIAMSAALGADRRVVEVNAAGRPPLVAHYWGNKEAWNDAICRRLATIHLAGVPLDAAVEHLRQAPIRLPLKARRRWWHRLLRVEPGRVPLPG
jgi:hypothetical protein